MITCICPKCDEELEVGDRKLGKMIECPECGAKFEVGEEAAWEKPAKKRRKIASAHLSTADLRQVALFQRAIMFCILAYFAVGIASFAIPEDSRWVILFAAVPVVLAAATFVFLLAVTTTRWASCWAS